MTIKHGTPTSNDAQLARILSVTQNALPELSCPEAEAMQSLTADELKKQEVILKEFTATEQHILKRSVEMLAVLGQYMSKDFAIPVLLGEPGGGWCWNFKDNRIYVDPKDILTKPDSYLRFVIAHEAAHRRITKVGPIPEELWKEPGYPFMTNAIEDPRINNFITDVYPVLRADRDVTYSLHAEFEKRAKEKADDMLGYRPRFVTAGLQYISQWFLKEQGKAFAIPADLATDVRQCLEATLSAAEESWNYYPSLTEERVLAQSVSAYAKKSFEINRDKIWPEFKKLIEKDLEDQRVAELLEELSDGAGEDGDAEGQELKSKVEEGLSEEEKEALEEAINNGQVTPGAGGGKPIPLESLSEDLRQKLKEFFNGMSEEEKKEWTERAQKKFKEYEESLVGELEDQRAAEQAEGAEGDEGFGDADGPAQEADVRPSSPGNSTDGSDIMTDNPASFDVLDDILHPETAKRPHDYRREFKRQGSLVNRLVDTLRTVFHEKRQRLKNDGHKSGRNVKISRRLKEVARDIPPVKTRSFERNTKPLEHDYAVTLVMDLSSSMNGEKIKEAFKALVVAAEALEQIGVRFEILGFNSALHLYHEYGHSFDEDTRKRLGGMLNEVTNSDRSNNTDDGWALSQASERLERVKAKKKIIVMVCDGISNQSSPHNHPEYKLERVLQNMDANTEQYVVGVGLGDNTRHVAGRFPHGQGDVQAIDFPEVLGELLKEALEKL
jgi:cobalamin biosynthesis protein CobT